MNESSSSYITALALVFVILGWSDLRAARLSKSAPLRLEGIGDLLCAAGAFLWATYASPIWTGIVLSSGVLSVTLGMIWRAGVQRREGGLGRKRLTASKRRSSSHLCKVYQLRSYCQAMSAGGWRLVAGAGLVPGLVWALAGYTVQGVFLGILGAVLIGTILVRRSFRPSQTARYR